MTKDTLPSPVTLSTPDIEKLRDRVIDAARRFVGAATADDHYDYLAGLNHAIALLDSLPFPVSVPEGDAREMGFSAALERAQAGYLIWAMKPHNKKWVARIDGTPIPNDLLVNIANQFASLPLSSPEEG